MSAVSGLEQNISKTVKYLMHSTGQKDDNLPVRVQSKKGRNQQYLKQI